MVKEESDLKYNLTNYTIYIALHSRIQIFRL